MTDKSITISFETTSKAAWALAQFLKRLDHESVKRLTSEDELYEALAALDQLQRGLKECGISPR
jgi:GTP cyclohydrolase II